jgi:hypothetical protein
VIHCGDIIGTQTLRAAMSVGLPLHVIHGNNLGDPISLNRWARESGGLLQYHGADARLDLGGRRVFVVHYPEYGYAMACTGDWDVVCCGHSHVAGIQQVANVKNGKTWLVNPAPSRALPRLPRGCSVTWPRCNSIYGAWNGRTRTYSRYGRKRERVAWGANRGGRRSQDLRSWRGEQQRVAPQDARSFRVAAENAFVSIA